MFDSFSTSLFSVTVHMQLSNKSCGLYFQKHQHVTTTSDTANLARGAIVSYFTYYSSLLTGLLAPILASLHFPPSFLHDLSKTRACHNLLWLSITLRMKPKVLSRTQDLYDLASGLSLHSFAIALLQPQCPHFWAINSPWTLPSVTSAPVTSTQKPLL